MKKFTLSYLADSDSNKSVNSLANTSNTYVQIELPKITELHIIIKDLNTQTMLKVIGDAVILDIKKKLLHTFGNLLNDSQNMGLYQPDEPSRKGKFLEEERLLSEYISGKIVISLEFIYKRRTVSPFHMSPTLMSKISKNFIKTFFRYVSRGECQKVGKLLLKGFDPNIHCPKTGETPLTVAVTRSKPYEMISTLISGGAHRDFYSLSGYTPLHKAVTVGNFEGVKTLLDFGQSPNCLDRSGLTPLYYNILYDPDTRICHSLLYEHSKIGVVDKDGLQEIHQATRLNRVEQINLLLMYGADVNARCKRPKEVVNSLNLCIRPQSIDGDTPLHVAANYNQRAAVLRLLSWGADPTLVNTENMTPIQVAQNNGNTELAELIRLFRGRKESSDVFLPTPTYNPHRRIRQPPPNSYITEPSTQNCPLNNNHYNNNIQLKPKVKGTTMSKSRLNICSPSYQQQQEPQQQQQQKQQRSILSGSICNKSVKERRISRGQQTDVLFDFINAEAKRFQREGSQTDSGISSSSCRPGTFGSLTRSRIEYSMNNGCNNTNNTSIIDDNLKDKYQEEVFSSYENSNSQTNVKCNFNRQPTHFPRDSTNDRSYMHKIKGQSYTGKVVHVNVRDSRHLPRSSTLHGYLDIICAVNSTDNVRTVTLDRHTYSNGVDKNGRSSFGLSIRTVKNASVIAEFTPTPTDLVYKLLNV
ncbi:unnamed protein product [Heterobilharzia americana]|nr:unnamed protein product [Heterobilharzia americana]